MSHVSIRAGTGDLLEALIEQVRAFIHVWLVSDERRHRIRALVLSSVLAMTLNRLIGKKRPLRRVWVLPCRVPRRFWEFGAVPVDSLLSGWRRDGIAVWAVANDLTYVGVVSMFAFAYKGWVLKEKHAKGRAHHVFDAVRCYPTRIHLFLLAIDTKGP